MNARQTSPTWGDWLEYLGTLEESLEDPRRAGNPSFPQAEPGAIESQLGFDWIAPGTHSHPDQDRR